MCYDCYKKIYTPCIEGENCLMKTPPDHGPKLCKYKRCWDCSVR